MVAAVLALDCLTGRWRWLAAALLVLPSIFVPLRQAPAGVLVPTSASPTELARIAAVKRGLPPILPSARGFYAPGFHRLASLQKLESRPISVDERARDAHGGWWQLGTERPAEVLLPLQW